MGNKQTKIEGSYLPDTPVTKCKTSKNISAVCNPDLDPRSPAGCRTPILIQAKRNDINVQTSCADIPDRDQNNEKGIDVLRKRFLKSFTNNLNDPRSPSLNLNRTPIMFEDTLEKPLSLDDTFSNLFVEPLLTNTSCKVVNSDEVSNKRQDDQKEKMFRDLEETFIGQQQFDPRSPSVGVERTPIIFTDDEIDETREDIMLESILASLSLDMNSSSNSESTATCKRSKMEILPVNKHLDVVRTGKKNIQKLKNFKPKQRALRRKIYEDQENQTPMTPILNIRQADKKIQLKGTRSPFSCIRNRNDTRLALTSFDDTLNPSENYTISKLRTMQQ